MGDKNVLAHYGVLGMKWGVRRSEAQLAKTRGKKSSSDTSGDTKAKDSKESSSGKKKPSEMTDDELRNHISRLELEKRYSELAKAAAPPPKSTRGKDFVNRVLEKSGENIATQFTTYVMGTSVNKFFEGIFKDPSIVNPKKGQKDK